MRRYGNKMTRDLSFSCDSAELPGRTLATIDTRTYGPTVKGPYQSQYSDLNLTMYVTGNKLAGFVFPRSDTGLLEKSFFDDWMEVINPTQSSSKWGWNNIAYKNEYLSTISISHYDTNGFRTQTIDFIDAYPIAVNQVSLAWADDAIMKLSVTMAYTRWERKTDVFTQTTDGGVGDIVSTSQFPDLLEIIGVVGDALSSSQRLDLNGVVRVVDELGIRPPFIPFVN